MPIYRVEGRGTESGRNRKPSIIRANTEQGAKQKAKKDGITSDSISLIDITHFVAQVAGASHKNSDNTSRQKIVHSCSIPERLILEHEEGNRHDKHATKVLRMNGQQPGYLPQDQAKTLIDDFFKPDGCLYSAFVIGREPLDDARSIFTLNICVFMALPSADEKAVRLYVSSTIEELGTGLQLEDAIPTTPLISKKRVPQQQQRKTAAPPQSKQNQSGCLVVALSLVVLVVLALI